MTLLRKASTMFGHRPRSTETTSASPELPHVQCSKTGHSQRNLARNSRDIVIAVMGMTGAGKSSFISTLTCRNDVKVGHNLESETSEVKSYTFCHGSRNYVLVDTPGFDDSSMSNDEVTQLLVRWLETSYRDGTRLAGILYLHNITKSRMQGSAFQNIRMFRRLCGDAALKNVILVTSFWDQVDAELGEKRERELLESKDFWANMVAKGSQTMRLHHDLSSCLRVLERVGQESGEGLLIQRELVDEKKTMADTAVGQEMKAAQLAKEEKKMQKERAKEKKNLQTQLKKTEKDGAKQLKKAQKDQQWAQRKQSMKQWYAGAKHAMQVELDKWEDGRERYLMQQEAARLRDEENRRTARQQWEQDCLRREIASARRRAEELRY